MDVGGWLRGLGLGQYKAAFPDNAIDVGVLPDLTDQDLEKLGLPLGDRRKLLRAIAEVSSADAVTSKSAAAATISCADELALTLRRKGFRGTFIVPLPASLNT